MCQSEIVTLIHTTFAVGASVAQPPFDVVVSLWYALEGVVGVCVEVSSPPEYANPFQTFNVPPLDGAVHAARLFPSAGRK